MHTDTVITADELGSYWSRCPPTRRLRTTRMCRIHHGHNPQRQAGPRAEDAKYDTKRAPAAILESEEY